MLFTVTIYLIPTALLGSVVFFTVSLYRYLSAKRRNGAFPDDLDGTEPKRRKTLFTAASITLGALLLITVGLVSLLASAIAHM